jgi:WD40 repeat protein/formylglycine-generating enzyme required for sulfatase activity
MQFVAAKASSGMTAQFKYKAFISYSHADRAWGNWLHKALESYRVPKRMVGKPGRDGPVSARLYPIFRDREELPTSSDLGQQINEALENAAYLIVICSPHAAKSRWVNEEILTFKRLGRNNRILALIVGGEPHAAHRPGPAAKQECFPQALMFSLNAQGEPEFPVEPLAADVRPGQDKKVDAKLKLIAGVLGVGFDELKQRNHEATAQRRRRWLAAAGLAGLIVAAGLWQIDRSNLEAKQNQVQAQNDRSRKFAVASHDELNAGHTDRALALALEGIPLRPPGGGTAEAYAAVTAASAESLQFAETIIDAGAGSVSAAAFSPDGKLIVTLETDKGAQIWDTETGKPLGAQLPPDDASAFAFSPNGAQLLVVARNEGRLWDLATHQQVGQSMEHKSKILAVQFTPDSRHVVTISADGSVHTWDAATAALLGSPLQLDLGESSLSDRSFVVLSPDAARAVTIFGNAAQLYDVQTGARLGAEMSHDRIVRSAAFSADGTRLLTVSWNTATGLNPESQTTDGIVRAWDGHTGAPIGPPLEHRGPVLSAAFSPRSSRYIVTGSQNGIVQLWDAVSGNQYRENRIDGEAKIVGFTPDGTRILTVAGDTARLWDTSTGGLVGIPRKAESDIVVAAFSSDSKRLLVVGAHDRVQVWNAILGAALSPPMKTPSDGGSVVVSGNGDLVATISGGTVALWEDDGTRLDVPVDDTSTVNSAAFSPDSGHLLLALADGTVRLWDIGTAKAAGMPIKLSSAANSAVFSPDGTQILATSGDIARLFDAKTMASVWTLRHDDTVRSAVFSPDGVRILTVSADTARIWNARTGEPLGTPMRHTDVISAAAFSADGKHVVTASMDGTVRFWDATTGNPLGRPFEAGLPVKAAALSHDGTRLLTITGLDMRGAGIGAVADDRAAIWEVKDIEIAPDPLMNDGNAGSSSFSPDGTRFAVAYTDGTFRMWDAATGAPLGQPFRFNTSAPAIAFTPDNERLVTITYSGARVWYVGASPIPVLQRPVVDYLSSFYALNNVDRRRYHLPELNAAAIGKAEDCNAPEIERHASQPRGIMAAGSGLDPDIARRAWRLACEKKMAAEPDEPRFRYQRGRALQELGDEDAALAAFEQAAKAGYARAFIAMGDLYEGRQDAARTVDAFENASQHGIPEGEARLADLSWVGDLVPLDRDKAMRLWRSAADRGDVYSNEKLATLYESGSEPEAPLDLNAAFYRWAMADELTRRIGVDDTYVRARRASLARYFGRMDQSKLIGQVWDKVIVTLADDRATATDRVWSEVVATVGALPYRKLLNDWLARLHSDALSSSQERAFKPKDTFKECADCPEMVVVPSGSFIMGSATWKDYVAISAEFAFQFAYQEGPQHKVTIAEPLAVSKFEVTFDEWNTCAAAGNCAPHVRSAASNSGRLPITGVSWDDAQIYVAWLSRTTGRHYRLLSEAEYEYATRAGTRTTFWWGDEVGVGHANCDECGSKWDSPAPVDSFAPNAFGLYDMVGNVFEWVDDCAHKNYEGAPTDGSAWIDSGGCNLHQTRGGAYYTDADALRSAARSAFYTGLEDKMPAGVWPMADFEKLNEHRLAHGFRVARSLLDLDSPLHSAR